MAVTGDIPGGYPMVKAGGRELTHATISRKKEGSWAAIGGAAVGSIDTPSVGGSWCRLLLLDKGRI